MKFFIKTKSEFKETLQTGTQLKLSMNERFVWVTIAEIEKDKVFFEATGDDEKYLQSLFEEKVNSFSIESR